MTSYETRAKQLVNEAKKKLSWSRGLFGFLFGGTTKIKDAAGSYWKAANLFKISGKWLEAGGAYCESANLYLKTDSSHEAASRYIDAAGCYKKFNPAEAINCYFKAIDIYTDRGQFKKAAEIHISIAELYENGLFDQKLSADHYKQASEYFKCDDNNWAACSCSVKVAQYVAICENYQQAILIYEELIAVCLLNPLLKINLNGYFFYACLCHLCVDLINCRHALKLYFKMYPTFQDSRVYKFLEKLMEHIEGQDCDAFTACVQKYDSHSVYRLHPWDTTMLLITRITTNKYK